ncbi:MAG: type VI secretion system baseplate subunit TssK [Saccharospirillaceae bacterium]|nr:type VI secretion system baseplate subunit TssK [Pseudomonadales bacterium]NRB81225.1 type VI secretion system baseplate subunit TssK [Saccharospirillaceae bacterium]
MDNLKPIFWHQGLFLQPQHFQLSDQYQRSLIQPFQKHLHAHFWGVAALDLNSSALEHRSCEINSGQFLFQDGTYVNLPNDAIIQKRSFDEAWVEADKPFTIYVGIKKISSHKENVTVVNNFDNLSDISTRYVTKSDPENIKDIYKDGPDAPTKLLTHVLKFIWENEIEQLEDYLLIPIAKVLRTENGIEFSAIFYPPVLAINVNDDLSRIIKEIRDELTGRITQLTSYDNSSNDSMKYDATLMRYKLAARTLSRYIPKLFHYTDTGDIHPWDVYGVLRELIGEISTFTESVNVLGETFDGVRLIPNYDHQDIGLCFNKAKDLLATLLNEITVGPQFIVEMPLIGNVFKADIPQEFFEQRVDFYLIVSTQTSFQEQQTSLLTTSKLAAFDVVEVLAERSLPGVGLIHVANPPADMPRRPDAHYVRLDTHDEQWPIVERHKDIALLWDEAPEDVKIELVIVRR